MSKYKLLGMAFAALLIIAGFVYLYADGMPLFVSLGISALSVLGMGVSNALEARSSGARGAVAYIPAICLLILGTFVAAVCVYSVIK